MVKRLKKYYTFTIVGLAIFMFCAMTRELFSGLPATETFTTLSDCFFVPGVMLAGIGGISWISSVGGYDLLGYGGETLKSHFTQVKDRRESYYNYKLRRAKERGPWLREAFFSGAAFILLSVVCTVLY